MNPFFIIVFLVYTLINSYIFIRGWQAIPCSVIARIIYCAVFFVFYSSFIIAMLGRDILPLGSQKILSFWGSTWFAVMLYITLYFLLTDIVHLLNHFFHFLPKTITPVVFHQIQVISGYTIVAILLVFGYVRFSNPVIVEKEIVINKSGGAHKSLKVVAFSDIHLGVSIDKQQLKRYVQLVNDQQPDLILIAGDMIDNSVRPLHEENMQEELNQLKAPLGVYFCLGNHEYISGIDKSLGFLEKTNITVLADSVVSIDDSFWIIGRDDRMVKRRMPINQLVAKTNPEQPLFLLDHQPYHLEEAEKNGIDFQFSGHTHNAQLWPFNYVVDMIYELGHGYKQKGNTHIYVSSGLTLWGPKFRIGTQSELVVFNIHFED